MGNDPAAALDIPGVTRTPPRELGTDDREVWERLARNLNRLTELLADIEDDKDTLREHLGRGEYAIDGKKVFGILGGVRWSEEQARRVLPAEVVAQLEVTILSAHAAGELLRKETYAQCQVPHGKDRVVPVRDRGKRR